MHRLTVRALVAVLAAALVAVRPAATGSQSPKPATKPVPTVVTLTGCVGGGKSAGEPFTLSSEDGSVAYKLTGISMRRYEGERVQIVGGPDTRRFRIVGGLTPSPNAAAQAGALDPARAAIAADPLLTSPK